MPAASGAFQLATNVRATVFILVALPALLGAVAAQGPPDGTKLAAAYAEAFNARDAAKLAALYTEDGVWMPQTGRW